MKSVLPLCFIFLAIASFSQPGQFFYGGSGRDLIQQIKPTSDGNFYLLGSKSSGASSLVWLQKVGPSGTVLWEKTYTASTPGINEFGQGLTVLPNGKLLITGQQRSNDVFNSGTSLAIQTESDGTQIWKKTYANTSALFDGIPSGNGFLLVGWTDNTGSGNSGLLMLVNASGTLQWKIPVEVYNQTYVKRIFPTSDGNFLLVGRTNVIGVGFEGIFLSKVEADGDLIWQKTYNTSYREQDDFPDPADYYFEPLGAAQMPDGSVWITNPKDYYPDIALVQYSQDGDLLQEKTYGNASIDEYPYSLTPLQDGGLLVAGIAQVHDGVSFENNGFALRTSAQGLEIWRKYYGKTMVTERLFANAALTDGQFLLVGMSNSNMGNGNSDGWLVKAEADGNIFPWTVEGQVVIDQNSNCQLDIGDSAAGGWFLTTNNPNAEHILTDADGKFKVRTDDATTIFTLLPPSSGAWTICNNAQSVNSNSSNPEVQLEFVAQASDGGCPNTEVSITQPDMVRCDTNRFFVTVTNRGVAESSDLLLDLEIAPSLKLVSASEPFTLSGDKLRFELSPMPGLQSKYIEVWVRVECDVQLGASHPVVAKLSPLECSPNWTGPQFTVDGECDGSTVRFDLQNIGGGGLTATTQYRVLSDYLLATDWVSINLPEGAPAQTMNFPADGRTWRVELQQAPGYPTDSRPAASVEGCGLADNFLHSIAYQDVWPFDEGAPNIAAILPTNTTGVPNKVGEALHGLGLYNLIEELAPLEYTARLHNPLPTIGEDVQFILKFSPNLDITTFQIVASNGPVELSLTDDGSIRATMKNLQLASGPTADADAMLRFRIDPLPGIPADSAESLFLVEALGFVNDFGPINLSPGFQNYTNTFPVEVDEYNSYPSEIILYGDRNYTFGTKLEQAADGAVFLVGETFSYSDRTNYDGLVIKTNQYGRAFWLNAIDLGDGGSNTFRGVAPLTDGGCLAVGNYTPPLVTTNYLSDNTPYIARLDANGNMTWNKKIRPAGNEFGAWTNGIIATSDGNYVMYGYTQNTSTNGIDQFYIKINEDGDVLWQKHQQQSNSAFQPTRAIQMADGGLVFCGENPSTSVNAEIYLEKIDNAGNSLWKKGYSSTNGIFEFGIAPAADGGLMLAGTSQWEIAPNDYGITPGFMKFTPDGDLEWEKYPIVGPFNIAWPYNITPAPDGGYFVCGEILADTLDHGSDILLLKIDENADTLWWNAFGAKNTEWAEDILVSDSNQILLWGFNQSRPPLWDLRAVLARVSAEGELYVDTHENPKQTAYQAVLFPNPTKGISYAILSPAPEQPVEWRLFDMNGKLVNNGATNNGVIEIMADRLGTSIYYLCFPGSKYPPQRMVVMH